MFNSLERISLQSLSLTYMKTEHLIVLNDVCMIIEQKATDGSAGTHHNKKKVRTLGLVIRLFV